MIRYGELESKDKEFEELKAAVVCQAAIDYVRALRGKKIGKKKLPENAVIECERFFLGKTFKLFSKLDGKKLMLGLREIAKDETNQLPEDGVEAMRRLS